MQHMTRDSYETHYDKHHSLGERFEAYVDRYYLDCVALTHDDETTGSAVQTFVVTVLGFRKDNCLPCNMNEAVEIMIEHQKDLSQVCDVEEYYIAYREDEARTFLYERMKAILSEVIFESP